MSKHTKLVGVTTIGLLGFAAWQLRFLRASTKQQGTPPRRLRDGGAFAFITE